MKGNLPFFAAFATVAGPVMFVRGFAAWRRRRLIGDTPQSKIRSMAMGIVEVTGTALPRSGVEAPFSGKSCVYWKVDISARSRNGWTVIHHNTSASPFYLRDETGLALVFPQGAECKLEGGVEEVCNGLTLPDCYSSYLRDHPTALGPFARAGMMRFREYLVEEGRPLFVLGSAIPKARALEVSDSDAFAATGTDDPGAVAARAARLHTLDGEVRASIRRGENDHTFIISEESQLMMMAELGIKAVAYLVLGPIIALMGLGYWLSMWSHGHTP
ncbi:MAG: GIDE domain-containing protein [Candidatus Eisenbacteria bacterium]